MKRGFLVTVSALLLLAVSLLFSQSNQSIGRNEERAIADFQAMDLPAYTFDDVACDLASMLGPQVNISRNSSSTNITFAEQLPQSNYSSLLSNYSGFISNYSGEMNSQIGLNFSGILNGTLLIFSNGLRYDRNSTSLRFYSSNGSTNASAYVLNIFANDQMASQNISSLQNSGSVNLTINYYDLSGGIQASGTFNPNSLASYSVLYTSGSSLNITVGNFSGSSDSIWVGQTGPVQVGVNLTASGGWNSSLGYAYNALMNYSRIRISKNDLVWVGRG